MARIVHSPAAEGDLLEIWVGLAANNVSVAERLLNDLRAATQILATQPLIGKARREFGAGIRSFPVRDYVIVYRPILDGVEGVSTDLLLRLLGVLGVRVELKFRRAA
jgi:toxin ParE1/3/4